MVWTPTPATSTLTVMQGEILNYVMAPSDTEATAMATSAIRAAIRRVNSKRWWWSRSVVDKSLIAGTRTYELSGNFKSERSAVLLDSASVIKGELQYLQPRDFDDGTFAASAQGTPQAYTLYNAQTDGLVTLDVAPSAGVVAATPTLRVRYYKRLAFLASGSDTLDAPSEVEEFVSWYAKAYVASNWDPAKYAMAKGEAEGMWTTLIRDNARQELTDW